MQVSPYRLSGYGPDPGRMSNPGNGGKMQKKDTKKTSLSLTSDVQRMVEDFALTDRRNKTNSINILIMMGYEAWKKRGSNDTQTD